MNSVRIRVSIANLAWYAKVMGKDIQHPIAILNPKKLEKGERHYMALGGGAMLTESGKALLERDFGASDFEFDKKTGFFDARFQINEEHLETVFWLFTMDGMKAHEHDRTLDFMAELSKEEFPGYGHILREDEVKLIRPNFARVVRQKPSEAGADTSVRSSVELPTRRLFRIFELEMPGMLFEKLHYSPVIRFLSDEELMTTDGGSRPGRTNDGYRIQNNLFVP
jgi:hypothetical protein